MTREQIGSVNILLDRVYPRYAGTDTTPASGGDVYVEAGVWPVYRGDDGRIYWEMSGTLSRRRADFTKIDGGMFVGRTWDEPTGDGEVIFRSMAYTRDAFIEFLHTDPVVVGGRREKRLVFEVVL